MSGSSGTSNDKPKPGEEQAYNKAQKEIRWNDLNVFDDQPEMVDPNADEIDPDDIIVENSDEEEKDGDDSEQEGSQVNSDLDVEEVKNKQIITEEVSGFIQEIQCSCVSVDSPLKALTLLNCLLDQPINKLTLDCLIDNIIRAVNCVFENCTDVVCVEKVACVDMFYRLRHEILFTLMAWSFHLPQGKTDMKFSEFGIESERTPDLIYDYNDVLYIIEVSAVGNMERGIQAKGVESFGFEGKYKKEIDSLIFLKKRSVKYLPLIFNMSDPETPNLLEQLNAFEEVFPKSKSSFKLMQVKSTVLSMISMDFKDQFMLSSTLLFSKQVDIGDEHQGYKFLYKKDNHRNIDYDYEEVIISPYVYNKITNEWGRLESRIINKDIPENSPIELKLSLLTGLINVNKSPSGVRCGEVLEMLKNNDKIGILRVLKLEVQGVNYSSLDNTKGVKFHIKRMQKREDHRKGSITRKSQHKQTSLFSHHKESEFQENNVNLNKYVKFVNSEEGIHYNLECFDNNYEDNYINKICEFDSECNNSGVMENICGSESSNLKGLLGLRSTLSINIDNTMKGVIEGYYLKNQANDNIPVKVLKMKSPFIYPLSSVCSNDYCSLGFKNVLLLDSLKSVMGHQNTYTVKIIDQIRKPDFILFEQSKIPSRIYNDLLKRRINASNEINKLQKEAYKQGTTDGVNRVSKTKDERYRGKYESLKTRFNEVNKLLIDRGKTEKITRNKGFIRLPTKNKGNNQLSIDFNNEMSHFRDKGVQSTIEGVGIIDNLESDLIRDTHIFNEICNRLSSYSGENKDSLIDYHVSKDVKLLQELKEKSIEDYKPLIDQVKDSQLGHSCSFVSRLCYTLMYLSQQAFNSDYIKIDNLGYKNVFLFVRGGKKIFKSKSSKLFRLIYPIVEESLPWYTEGRSNKGSNEILKTNEGTFLMTPWSMFHESILTDGISFYPRVCSFTILSLNNRLGLTSQFNLVSMNVLLAFHNRRQTEVLLANMRYILLSTMGDFTGLEDILCEFFGFNYDRFQSFIRNSIAINYPVYFKKLHDLKLSKNDRVFEDITVSDFRKCGLKNIFTNECINKVEELTLMIYSTFLMTKAPYQKLVERSSNLKGILKIHEQYENEVGLRISQKDQFEILNVELKSSYKDYAEELFNCDFNFDAKLCSVIGNFINSEFNNSGQKEEIYNKWYHVLNESWDEMATSTGLRGHFDDLENFWGQKGYFVVYKDILEKPGFTSKLNELFLSCTLSEDEKRRELKKLNMTFLKNISLDKEFLIFHAVDKVQWKGSREIYVMDIDTKMLQQPIEKFMGFLCKKLDNELISIPSDKRTQVIHHSIFEKDLPLKETITWYLTLDCTKWAPKSVFVKFIVTFLPMDCLPNSFKRHFMNYCEKLFYKRIYFNEKEVEVLKNNIQYESACFKYLIRDEERKGYYLLMPYSWVMGIFNYTSSFLHAANQKYMSYILMTTSIRSYKEETSLYMFAHSDDSGGRLTAPNYELAVRGLIIYEIGLKACNHLLSKKKSVISRIYFEILSIIYMFKKLLALLPKFLGGLRFLPTDKGFCQDMSQSYSKSIEVMVAGATFSTAYIVFKIYSMMVWRFYCNQTPTENDYLRPVQYMGLPDSHPLMQLLCGSDSDIVRIYYTNREMLERLMSYNMVLMQNIEDVGPIKPFKFEIKVKNIKKDFIESIEDFGVALESWSVRNVNYHNTAMNYLNFLSKLKDSGFVGSLVNESVVRRISRCFFMRNNETVMTKFGNLKISNILDSLRLYQGYIREDESVEMILNEILSEEDIANVNSDISETKKNVQSQLKILSEVMNSPLKVCKYLDQLSLQNRKFNYQPRTLKPTALQLIKSNPLFSSRFDEPTLVSYIKEPEMRWAVNEIKGIFTSEIELRSLLVNKGINIDDVEPDNLLRMCRDFGSKSTKTIYLYSRVPSELRQVRSYSSFLTFLSVNSFENTEISGLTLKLGQKDMNSEYVRTFINDETYSLMNMLSALCVLFLKIDYKFFCSITLNPIEEINFPGGDVLSMINCITLNLNNDPCMIYYQPYLNYLRIIVENVNTSANSLKKGSFYTFLKTQKMRSGWYGKGEIYISIESRFYSFELFNNQITKVSTNNSGKVPVYHSDFILDIMYHNQLEINNMPKIESRASIKSKEYFGFDYSGHLSCAGSRELLTGVPCVIKSFRGCFCDELYNYDITNLSENIISISMASMDKISSKKLYLAPLKKGEIIGTYLRILKKEEFGLKLLEMGLSDFEDFIYTELLTEYGQEVYIDYEDLFDNFPGSKVYEIFKKCRQGNISFMPRTVKFSNFPASEGSLTRILVDYGEATGDTIITVNRDLNSTFMKIRSEFPEQMSVVLTEKLIEYYPKMYTKEERKEISDEYHCLSSSTDGNIIRRSIIRLMTYWGFGGLVNTIESFSLKRQPSNYNYFNLTGLNSNRINVMSDLFVFFLKETMNVMLEWSEQYRLTPVSNMRLRNQNGLLDVCRGFVKYICISCFDYMMFEPMPDLSSIQFNSALINLLQEEDFCASLQSRLSENYILGSIPINYGLRKEIIVSLNTLRHLWSKNNVINYELQHHIKNEMLPDNVPSWKSISRQFGIDTPPTWSFYNGGVSPHTLNELLKRTNSRVDTRFGRYTLSSTLKPFSKVRVETSSEWSPSRPIKESVFQKDEWDELDYEMTTVDKDVETMREYIRDLGNMYVTKSTKIRGFGKTKEIIANITILVGTNGACRPSRIKYVRQTGQNIILLSTSYSPSLINSLYNCTSRVIQYTKGETLYCYISFQNELNNAELIDRLIGKVKNLITSTDVEENFCCLLRDRDGEIKESSDIGFFFDDSLMSGEKEVVEDEDVEVVKDKQTSDDEEGKITQNETSNEGSDLGLSISQDNLDGLSKVERGLKIMGVINGLESRGLSSKTVNSLKSKYLKLIDDHKLKFDIVMGSLITEIELNSIKSEFEEGSLSLSASQYKNIIVSPGRFEAAHGMSNYQSEVIRNKKLNAELSCLHESLPNKIGAGVIHLSKRMKRICKANLKLWNSMVKSAEHKKESKAFSVFYFTTLLNSVSNIDSDKDDDIFHVIIDKISLYVTDEVDESDDDDLVGLFDGFKASSRLKYMPKGS